VIDVTVKVEEGRLGEFYAMYAEWLQAPASAQDAVLTDWGPEDLSEAKSVWSRMSGPAKRLFKLLPAAPTSVVWTELAGALGDGADSYTVGGTLGWPARYAKDVGRKRPVRARDTPSGTVYWLEPTVKALFDKVQAEFE
jgi:hypothetical protein